MATAFRFTCDCGHEEILRTSWGLQLARNCHVCPPAIIIELPVVLPPGARDRCSLCGYTGVTLVDDGDLCVRCDVLLYPNGVPGLAAG